MHETVRRRHRLIAAMLLITTVLVGFAEPAPARTAPENVLNIYVSRDANSLELRLGEDLVDRYAVSVGKRKYPTPKGTFRIRKIVWNPGWVPPPGAKWARGKSAARPGDPDNPMKKVKIFFKEPDYYIHGTGATERLGEAASHGCIRMDPDEATDLAKYIMEHGGNPRPEHWFRRLFRSRQTKVVYLQNPVQMVVVD